MAEEKEGTATKPIVISDDVEMVSSPDLVDFTISEKVLSTPHKHSKHAPQPVSTLSNEKNRKRGRSYGHRRSDLQEEVRLALEEAQDEFMDVDDDGDIVDLTSPAVDYATKMLSRSNSIVYTKESQPAASLSRRGSGRMAVQRYDGMKRMCRSSSAMSISPAPAPLYGEVM